MHDNLNIHQHHHNHTAAAGSPDEMAMCPVMHIPVNKAEAKAQGLTREYKGKTYYFCCNTCTGQFDNDQDKYAK